MVTKSDQDSYRATLMNFDRIGWNIIQPNKSTKSPESPCTHLRRSCLAGSYNNAYEVTMRSSLIRRQAAGTRRDGRHFGCVGKHFYTSHNSCPSLLFCSRSHHRSRWPQLQLLSSDSDLERSGRLSFEPRDAAVHAPGPVVRAVVADLVEGGEILEGRAVTEL